MPKYSDNLERCEKRTASSEQESKVRCDLVVAEAKNQGHFGAFRSHTPFPNKNKPANGMLRRSISPEFICVEVQLKLA